MSTPDEKGNDSYIVPLVKLRYYVESQKAVDLYNALRSGVYGQDAALRKASIMIYAYLVNAANRNYRDRMNFLIIGKSGSGKSTFAEQLKKCLPIPVFTIDGSTLAPSGYKGSSLGDALAAKMSESSFQEWQGLGICLIDELDKAMQPQQCSTPDYHRYTQESMLTAFDGGTTLDKDGHVIDCSRLLFIGLGAFSQIREELNQPEKQVIGFSCADAHHRRRKERLITKEDLVRHCGSEQFVGRFVDVLHFQPLGREVFEKMVDDAVAEINAIYGPWSITRHRRDAFVEKAMSSDFGGRSIRSEVWSFYMCGDHAITKADIERTSHPNSAEPFNLPEWDIRTLGA